jgi:hypothetical protein
MPLPAISTWSSEAVSLQTRYFIFLARVRRGYQAFEPGEHFTLYFSSVLDDIGVPSTGYMPH